MASLVIPPAVASSIYLIGLLSWLLALVIFGLGVGLLLWVQLTPPLSRGLRAAIFSRSAEARYAALSTPLSAVRRNASEERVHFVVCTAFFVVLINGAVFLSAMQFVTPLWDMLQRSLNTVPCPDGHGKAHCDTIYPTGLLVFVVLLTLGPLGIWAAVVAFNLLRQDDYNAWTRRSFPDYVGRESRPLSWLERVSQLLTFCISFAVSYWVADYLRHGNG